MLGAIINFFKGLEDYGCGKCKATFSRTRFQNDLVKTKNKLVMKEYWNENKIITLCDQCNDDFIDFFETLSDDDKKRMYSKKNANT